MRLKGLFCLGNPLPKQKSPSAHYMAPIAWDTKKCPSFLPKEAIIPNKARHPELDSGSAHLEVWCPTQADPK